MSKEVNTDISKAPLRDFADGFIRFNIKADDTEENQKVHEAFKEFCKLETDNNYTQGLRKLLEYYQGDFKYEMLYDRLDEQALLLQELKESVIQKQQRKEENTGLF